MLTGLSLRLDKSEYSRHEPQRSSIRVRVVPVPNTGLADTVMLAIRRKGGPVIFTQQVNLDGNLPKGQIATIDLTAIKDADGIPLAIRGDYQLDAYSPADGYTDPNIAGLQTASADFRISLITIEQMRKGYCFGAPLYASDTPAPLRQPVVVTGVTIDEVSEGTAPGVHSLAFDQANNTLSWSGGQAVTIGSSQEILPDQYGGYVQVTIDDFDLPAADASEGILIDKEKMPDETIRDEIEKAIAQAENTDLKVFLEPYRIATEPFFSDVPAGNWYDRKVSPVMFTRRDFNINGMDWHLDIPVQQLLKIDNLVGYMGNTQALNISSGAFAVNKRSGMLDVLPYNSQYSYLYTFFTQLRFWGVREFIADFWRYSGVAGLETCPADVLKMIGYTAAVTILTVAGQAYRGGYSSESNSKDGVSRAVTYTASATYGIYSASITEYKEWLKINLPRLQNQLRGVLGIVL